MPRIEFTVPGVPVAKARTRHGVMRQCLKCGGKLTAAPSCPKCGGYEMRAVREFEFTPDKTKNYESLVAMCAMEAMKKAGISKPMVAPLGLQIRAYFPIPESRKKGSGKLYSSDPHCQRPDADNVLKAICDGLNGVAYHDDCGVFHKDITKVWTDGGGMTQVMVEGMGELE